MEHKKQFRVVIVGGGTAGWMTAAALVQTFPTSMVEVTVVESPQIATVGVGESSIPGIISFNNLIGLNEKDFLRGTDGTFKLGIKFVNWGYEGSNYMHPFGANGFELDNIQFFHHWQRLLHEVGDTHINQFSVCSVAASEGKFCHPSNNPKSPLSSMRYSYHFDAIKYAKLLMDMSKYQGAKHIQDKVVQVNLNESRGYIESVQTEHQGTLCGDLFIDCTGFKSVLLGQTLGVKFEDWSHYLPCNRSVSVLSKGASRIPPYTESKTTSAGWIWKIPLQNRDGNGHVYCDKYMSTEEASNLLLQNLRGDQASELKHLSFKAGIRESSWYKNCVAIGLSNGFLEPLESTGIHSIHKSILNLLDLFPLNGYSQAEIKKYNSLMREDYKGIRNFIVAHYYANNKDSSPFWKNLRRMKLPESVKDKFEIYKANGRIFRENNELFSEEAWLALFHGQGVKSRGFHPIATIPPLTALKQQMSSIQKTITESVKVLPLHREFLNSYLY